MTKKRWERRGNLGAACHRQREAEESHVSSGFGKGGAIKCVGKSNITWSGRVAGTQGQIDPAPFMQLCFGSRYNNGVSLERTVQMGKPLLHSGEEKD